MKCYLLLDEISIFNILPTVLSVTMTHMTATF